MPEPRRYISVESVMQADDDHLPRTMFLLCVRCGDTFMGNTESFPYCPDCRIDTNRDAVTGEKKEASA